MLASYRYSFRQTFEVPARRAFEWCTDFSPEDGPLFEQRWIRSVKRLSDDTVVLTDRTFPKGKLRRIHRLVRIDAQRLAWTNTHLDGPFRHSQFWYRVVPDEARRSHLEFDGFQLENVARGPTPRGIARRSRELRTNDSRLWRERLAPALQAELRSSR